MAFLDDFLDPANQERDPRFPNAPYPGPMSIPFGKTNEVLPRFPNAPYPGPMSIPFGKTNEVLPRNFQEPSFGGSRTPIGNLARTALSNYGDYRNLTGLPRPQNRPFFNLLTDEGMRSPRSFFDEISGMRDKPRRAALPFEDQVDINKLVGMSPQDRLGYLEPITRGTATDTSQLLKDFLRAGPRGTPRIGDSEIAGIIREAMRTGGESSPSFKLGQLMITERGRTRDEDLRESLGRAGLAGSGIAMRGLETLGRQGDVDIGNLALTEGANAQNRAFSLEQATQQEYGTDLDRALQQFTGARNRGMAGEQISQNQFLNEHRFALTQEASRRAGP